MPEHLFTVVSAIDLAAVAVFAVTGGLAASRKGMDIFGFALLGVVTGVGGGTIRDIVLGRLPVFWVTDPTYVIVCVVAASMVFFTAHLVSSRIKAIVWMDAVGLSLFSLTGAALGLAAGVPLVVAIVMGVITATFGGILRDILAGESPLVLSQDIYVTAALAGSSAYVAMYHFGFEEEISALAGFLTCFAVRGLAITYGWQFPRYRPAAADNRAADPPEKQASEAREDGAG